MTAPAVKRRAPIRILPAGAPRDVWLAERAKGIGGSDVAAILGLDPFASPLTVYWSKAAPDSVIDEPSEAMEWGNRLEQAVVDHWAQTTGRQPRRAGLFAHPDRPWQRASVDRLVAATADDPAGVLEAKTTSVWQSSEWTDDGTIPDRARLQLAHYLAVMGLPHGWIAGLVGGQRFVTAHVERDAELEQMLVTAEADFWQRVVNRDEPLADAHPATKDLLGRLYEVEPEKIVDLPVGKVAPLLAARAEAKAHLDEWEQRKEAAENRLRQMLGGAEIGQVAGVVVATWKPQESTRVDVKRLRLEQPDVAAEYAKTSTSRVLRVKDVEL